MHDENMKKALQSRRGRGMDMSIILAPHEEKDKMDHAVGEHGVNPTEKEYEHDRKGDLAPMSDKPLDVDHGAGVPSPHPMSHSPLSELKDEDLLSGMSEYDKHDVAERAPRSLSERARKEMIMSATQRKK